jgi:hypothetical protein
MEGNFNLESVFLFLQAACKSKESMEGIELAQIAEASKHMSLLPRLNDKGLLILIIAKLLYHKFTQFPRVLRLFQAALVPVDKPTRMKRARAENGERRRRKRRPGRVEDVDLNELSNESITNPQGLVENPVLNLAEGTRAGQTDEESKGSKGSKPGSGADNAEPPLDSDFPEEFRKIEQ